MGVHDKLDKALADRGLSRNDLEPAAEAMQHFLTTPVLSVPALVLHDDPKEIAMLKEGFIDWIGGLTVDEKRYVTNGVHQTAVPRLPKALQGHGLTDFLAAIDGDPAKTVLNILAWT